MNDPEPIRFLDLRRWTEEDQPAIQRAFDRVLASGCFLHGNEVRSFEAELAEYCGVSHAVAVDSGTAALTLLLRAAGIGSGDEVIVSGFTCMPTWQAIAETGAIPVPVDVDANTRNMDPALVETAITDRTRAIVAVHLYGLPCDMEALAEICQRNSLRLFADAAQAMGAELNGRRNLIVGDACALSFYPTKNLAALGDGGAVVTTDGRLAETIALTRNYGMPTRDQCVARGINARMDELQAAVLRERLRLLTERNRRRRAIARRYNAGLDVARTGGMLPLDRDGHAWHVFSVLLPGGMRDLVARRMAAKGVETALHYPMAPHQTEAFANLVAGSLPVSERVAEQNLSLPLCPLMTDGEVDRVIRNFNRSV